MKVQAVTAGVHIEVLDQIIIHGYGNACRGARFDGDVENAASRDAGEVCEWILFGDETAGAGEGRAGNEAAAGEKQGGKGRSAESNGRTSASERGGPIHERTLQRGGRASRGNPKVEGRRPKRRPRCQN